MCCLTVYLLKRPSYSPPASPLERLPLYHCHLHDQSPIKLPITAPTVTVCWIAQSPQLTYAIRKSHLVSPRLRHLQRLTLLWGQRPGPLPWPTVGGGAPALAPAHLPPLLQAQRSLLPDPDPESALPFPSPETPSSPLYSMRLPCSPVPRFTASPSRPAWLPPPPTASSAPNAVPAGRSLSGNHRLGRQRSRPFTRAF